jgi:hypothetical protein
MGPAHCQDAADTDLLMMMKANRPGRSYCRTRLSGTPYPSSLHGRPLRLSRMRRERGSVDVVLPASSRFVRPEREQACALSDLISTAPDRICQRGGTKALSGIVLRENTTMLIMCRELGFDVWSDPRDASIMMVSLDLAAPQEPVGSPKRR